MMALEGPVTSLGKVDIKSLALSLLRWALGVRGIKMSQAAEEQLSYACNN